MRVITGIARGRCLETLEGDATRPTTEKVKEAVFSIIQFDIEGRNVLDLFAGTGQLGIEALSRGALSAVMVDSNKQAVEIIRKNIKICGFEDKSEVYCVDYKTFLAAKSGKFDIAFLDPPYAGGILEDAFLKVSKVMSESAVIICEHSPSVKMPDDIEGYKIQKQYKYGKISVTVFKKGEAVL